MVGAIFIGWTYGFFPLRCHRTWLILSMVRFAMNQRKDKDQLIQMLEQMIQSYKNLPSEAMQIPITNYDLCSSLTLILEIFRADSD